MNRDTLTAVLKARDAREAVVLITPLAGGKDEIVREGEVPSGHALAPEIAECFRSGRSRVAPGESGELFLQAMLPRPRLMIVGATHIGQVLVRLAREIEVDSFVIDPRTAFATEERFRNADIIAEWPGEALKRLGLDRRSGVVCLAHVPDIDDEALGAAMASRCFYIGALGSSRSHAKRVERLKAKGFGDDQIARIHGPVGLAIGSVTPNEIALSIMAQVIESLREPEKS